MSAGILAKGGLEFPPISHLLEWKTLFGTGWFSFNKIAIINFAALLLTVILFALAASKKAMVPKGVQNLVESSVDFVGTIAKDAIGHGYEKYLTLLTALFFFILFNNIFGIIPGVQMPATARMAVPMILSLLVWVVFIGAGIKSQGVGHYFGGALFPPGVPKALYILVTPIEFISTFIVRPFSLAVRLFANILAGHILLVTFTVLAETLFASSSWALKPVGVLPLAMLMIMTVFELGVAFLQAYVFTLLTAVFIGGAVHPEH
jgi:F-type H+-transporting ATPase subunit a